MSLGFSIQTSVSGSGIFFWTIDAASGDVLLRPLTSTTGDSRWSISNGILSYDGRQVMLNSTTSTLVLEPLTPGQLSPSPFTPATIVTCQGNCQGNWAVVSTSVFSVVPNPATLRVVFGTTANLATTITNQLAVQVADNNGFKPIIVNSQFTEAGGRAERPALYIATNTIYQSINGTNTEVPLNGLVPVRDIGTIVPGTAAPIVTSSTGTTTTTFSWLTWIVPIVFGLILGAILIFIITRKRTITTPLLSDPLVLSAVAAKSL